nr:melatonin receptor type 1A-A isoform X1 [Gasterosteus aculeatus aculeatus]
MFVFETSLWRCFVVTIKPRRCTQAGPSCPGGILLVIQVCVPLCGSTPSVPPTTLQPRFSLSDRAQVRLQSPVEQSGPRGLNKGNIFVVSLAVADLLVAIYPYPLVLTSIFHDGWDLGYVHCQISGFLMGVSVIGSIFNITGIAINRYCYICHSLKYDKLYSDANSVCYVVVIWALTVVAIVPNLFVGSIQYDPRVYSCTFEQSASSAYTIAVVFFHFILPIMIVTYCYLRIWILVIQVRRRVKPDNRPKLTPHDVRNFVTMFVVFVLFAVCWAPLNLIGLAVAIKPKEVIPLIPEWLFVASYFMAYFNSCLNAIVYGVLNQNFRREYKRIVVSVCTARIFLQDSSNDAGERIKSKPSPLMTNNNRVKVDSV